MQWFLTSNRFFLRRVSQVYSMHISITQHGASLISIASLYFCTASSPLNYEPYSRCCGFSNYFTAAATTWSVLLPAVERDLVELFHSSWWSGNFTMTWICCRPIIPIIEVTVAHFTRYFTGCSALLLDTVVPATNLTGCCLCCTTILLDITLAGHQFYQILHL